MESDDRSEKLFTHRAIVRPFHFNQRGPNEIAHGIVGFAARNDLCLIRTAGFIQITSELLECGSIDDSSQKISKIANVTHSQCVCGLDKTASHSLPKAVRNIDSRSSAALLSLILEPASHDCGDHSVGIRAGMNEDEIFSSCLAYKARIRPIFFDVFTDGPPHSLENFRGTREMNPCKVRMIQCDIADRRCIPGDKIDDARRQARCFEQLKDVVIAENSRTGRFPNDA